MAPTVLPQPFLLLHKTQLRLIKLVARVLTYQLPFTWSFAALSPDKYTPAVNKNRMLKAAAAMMATV
jgi:hypothetical protein